MISLQTRHTAIGVLVAAISIGAVMFYLMESAQPPAPSSTPAQTALAASEPAKPPSAGPKVGGRVARADRSIAPGAITPPPPVTGPLIRIEGIKPSLAQRPPPPKSVTLKPVAVVDAGALRDRAMTVLLARIRPLGIDSECTTADGVEWPCGRHARTALRKLIRGRAVVCWRADGGTFEGSMVTAECRIGKRNISRWLIGQGWATPAATTDAMDNRLLAAAREAKLGQWRGSIESVGATSTRPDVLTLDFNRTDLNLPEIDIQPFDLPNIGTDGVDGLAEPDFTGPIVDLPLSSEPTIAPAQ